MAWLVGHAGGVALAFCGGVRAPGNGRPATEAVRAVPSSGCRPRCGAGGAGEPAVTAAAAAAACAATCGAASGASCGRAAPSRASPATAAYGDGGLVHCTWSVRASMCCTCTCTMGRGLVGAAPAWAAPSLREDAMEMSLLLPPLRCTARPASSGGLRERVGVVVATGVPRRLASVGAPDRGVDRLAARGPAVGALSEILWPGSSLESSRLDRPLPPPAPRVGARKAEAVRFSRGEHTGDVTLVEGRSGVPRPVPGVAWRGESAGDGEAGRLVGTASVAIRLPVLKRQKWPSVRADRYCWRGWTGALFPAFPRRDMQPCDNQAFDDVSGESNPESQPTSAVEEVEAAEEMTSSSLESSSEK
mmetsp:Transcript_35767/g.89748  ORF Transcript_35767/g.89748 Transcript_35767/m.89748 type:complete len:361 (+) Transcript_35767:323-1405(+)